ncbi:solute carrier family 25 member 45 isoform X2 [Hoplias malabaricus]|uniref:solute carrier family 25 member 45 isoform X2 n=1 Tax=Hoplias malabaricus TaxID=27720 RepID=UPI003462D9C7
MPFVEFIAGWISGAIGLAVGHPMDTIKVRLQTQSIYKGIFHCVMQTYRHEGSQHKERNPDKKASLWSIYIAGCFSGLMQVLITAPIDLVKVRLQSQHTSHLERDGAKYRGPMHCVAVIFKEDGVRGLFRGMWALTLRDVPCFGLYFLPYELTCRMLTEKGKQPSMHVILVAGGIAGVVTWACATPMDVVKARLQMSGAGGRLYKGTLHCITASLQEEGIWVFFKGLLLNSLRAFPVNAVTFLSYEMLIRAMTASSTGCAQD